MTTLTYILSWVLPGVLAALGMGFYLGSALGRAERKKTLAALLALLETTEELTTEVDGHNSDLHSVERSVVDLDADGDLEQVQSALLSKISAVIDTNQKLEDDLVCAKYSLEHTAQELDRTRVEARTDTLAGLANRKDFDDTLQYWLSKSKRESDSFGLVIIDVDHFKWINDTHGHVAGDRVITHVGKFLRGLARDYDYIARYGGDEFVILLGQVDFPKAMEVAERLRQQAERENYDVGLDGERVAVTFSMGLTMLREGDTPDLILERADEALYRSKQGGRNQLHCHELDQEHALILEATV